MGTLPIGTEQFLAANSDAYQWLVGKIQARANVSKPEILLRRIEAAAQFAALSHTGRFADGAIENLALAIGADIKEPDGNEDVEPVPEDRVRRVVHYIDRALPVGGHTRMLTHWAREDRSSRHSLVLAFQDEVPLPPWLEAAIKDSGGTIFRLPRTPSRVERALFLRRLARRHADLVVLHHSVWDVLPTVAFAVAGLPPVAVLNHADHMFWLGSSIADIVINLRSAAIDHSRERRFVRRNAVLPVPLADPPLAADKGAARQALGIGTDEIVLLSVGRAEKYRPCGDHDFLATVGTILDREPRAHLYVVGESERGIAGHVDGPLHPRLHFVGEVEDPSPYRAAADIYLESFPFGSQTALLEAALAGLPVVPAAAPLNPLLVANDDALTEALPNPSDRQTYIDRAAALIGSPQSGVAQSEELRARLLARNVGAGWLGCLRLVYAQTDALIHSPHPIPIGTSSATEGDLGLCLWQVMSGRTVPAAVRRGGLSPLVSHGTFARQRVGDYRTARHKVLKTLATAPHRPSTWHLAIFSLRGHVGAALRWLQSLRHRPFVR